MKGGIKVGDYDYLLSMPIGTLTFEKVEQLQAQLNQMENEVEELKKATPKSLWEKDLDNFLVKLDVSALLLMFLLQGTCLITNFEGQCKVIKQLSLSSGLGYGDMQNGCARVSGVDFLL